MPDTPFGKKFGRQEMDDAVNHVIHTMQHEIVKNNGQLYENVASRLGDICWNSYMRWLEKGKDFKIDRERREYTQSHMIGLMCTAGAVARNEAKGKFERFVDRAEAIDLSNEICAKIHEAIELEHPELRSNK